MPWYYSTTNMMLRRSLTTIFTASQQSKRSISLLREKAYVNGNWVDASNKSSFEVKNPADGSVLGTVPDMDTDDVKTAIEAAKQSFKTWKNTTAKERGAVLRRWSNTMLDNKDDLAKLLTLEMGKSLTESRAEVVYAASFIEWFSEEARRAYGLTIPTPTNNKRIVVIKQPIGVAACITPWNFPLAMVTRKVGAAMAAGCTTVLKPAEETPYSALALCDLAERAGLPPGVINVVTSKSNTSAVGRELTTSPDIAAFSFTGSTAVGKLLLEQCSGTVKKVGLELGGNAPFIVFKSADIRKAVSNALLCKFRNLGQACTSANRFLVHEDVHDEFVALLSKAINTQIKLGNGLNPDATHGPLINAAAVEKVERHVKDAVSKGARVLIGGNNRPDLGECFYEPTLLTGVTTDMLCTSEETFGPVVAVLKFKTEDEALSIANETRSGLSGYIFSNDVNQCWRVAEALQIGMVGINEGVPSTAEAPFGGVKESGLGREGSTLGMDEFMEVKYLCFGGN